MRKNAVIIKTLCFITILISLQGKVFAQTDSIIVQKSTEKVLIDGKVYYIHTVKPGQTLYSIAKAYNITVEEIQKENPTATLVISIGQSLKIPEAPVDLSKEIAEQYPQDYYYHKVKKGETVFSISQIYDVSRDDIFQLNPGSDTLISIDQVLRIPKDDDNFNKRNFQEEDFGYFYYRVRRKDNLYRLSKEYDITIEKIIEANPILSEGLKSGQIIRIPKPHLEETVKKDIEIVDTLVVDSTMNYYSVFSRAMCDSIKQSGVQKNIRLAVLLPLYSDFIYRVYQADTVDREGELLDEAARLKKLRIRSGFFFEFYQGIELAADQLRKDGYTIEINLMDTERDTLKVDSMLHQLQAFSPDLIIGPVYPEIFGKVADFANINEIPIVSPFLSDIPQISNNSFIYQMIPSDSVKLHEFAHYINHQSNSPVRFIFFDTNEVSKRSIDLLTAGLQNTWNKFDSLTIIPVAFDVKEPHVLDKLLSKAFVNEIIIETTDVKFANNVISTLNTLSSMYNIRVYGSAEWQREEGVDLDFMHNIELAIYTPFYFNVKDETTLKVLKDFEKKYGYIPERLSKQGYTFGLFGYDIASVFLNAIGDYGASCYRCSEFFKSSFTLADYSFNRALPTSGFTNSSLYSIRFEKNFDVTMVKMGGRKDTNKKTYLDKIINYRFD